MAALQILYWKEKLLKIFKPKAAGQLEFAWCRALIIDHDQFLSYA